MLDISRRWGTKENSEPLEVTVRLEVWREDDEKPGLVLVNARVEVTAWTRTRQKILESSRLMSFTETRVEDHSVQDSPFMRSLRSDLRALVGALRQNA